MPEHTTVSADEFLVAQSQILEAVATGLPTAQVGAKLVALVERHIAGCTATLLSLDPNRQTLSLVAAGPDLPGEYAAMLQDAPIGPFGSCARAAFDGIPVIQAVTSESPDWAQLGELIERFDFRASWSYPFFDPVGELCGTIGLYFSEHRSPREPERQVLERAAHLGGIVVGHRRLVDEHARNETRFRRLVEQLGEGIMELDATHRVTYASPRVESMTRTNVPLEGKTLSDLFDLTTEQVETFEEGRQLEFLADGRWLRLRASSADAKGTVVVAHDVTDERHNRARLIQADRMASVGTLAAGVAHEINNPLMTLTLSLDALSFELEGKDEYAQLIEDAREGTSRVARIVRDLRSFASPTSERPGETHEPSDVASVLESARRLTRHELKHLISIEADVPEDLPSVALGPVRLGQVFINLLINAAQAFDDPQPSRSHVWVSAAREGDAVRVTVRDNGPGMDESLLGRIFEPFFTTKLDAGGTGLGLAIVHGMVRDAGGSVRVRSAPGQGTAFELRLPLADPPERVSAPGGTTGRRRLRLLLVDDEPELVRNVSRTLRTRGHEVTSAASGSEALELLEKDQAFDLILTDLMMPGMDGAMLAQRIQAAHPQLSQRIVFVTGGAVTARAQDALAQAPDRQLHKPFNVQEVEALAERTLG